MLDTPALLDRRLAAGCAVGARATRSGAEERQRDELTGESKYRINGKTDDTIEVETIVKLGQTGKVVIITIYRV